MDLKVKQLEEARLKFKPEANQSRVAGRRSLPSTPSEDVDMWNNPNKDLAVLLEDARKTIKLKDSEILQLKSTQVSSTPTYMSSPELESKGFKSPSQIAERSKTSSISFAAVKVLIQITIKRSVIIYAVKKPVKLQHEALRKPSQLSWSPQQTTLVPEPSSQKLQEILRVKEQEIQG
jgi:hypothetical protein